MAHYQQHRDKAMVGDLYKRYAHLTYGLCLKYLKEPARAEDAVMDIFEKLVQDLLKHDITNVKSWLYTYAKNYCLMQLRKTTYEVPVEDFAQHGATFMELSLDQHPMEEKEKMLQLLSTALEGLGAEQRICVELFYLKERTYAEVAEETGFEMKKVKSYIQNGKRNLMIALSRSGIPIAVIALWLKNVYLACIL